MQRTSREFDSVLIPRSTPTVIMNLLSRKFLIRTCSYLLELIEKCLYLYVYLKIYRQKYENRLTLEDDFVKNNCHQFAFVHC